MNGLKEGRSNYFNFFHFLAQRIIYLSFYIEIDDKKDIKQKFTDLYHFDSSYQPSFHNRFIIVKVIFHIWTKRYD